MSNFEESEKNTLWVQNPLEHPIVYGALGPPPRNLKERIERIGSETKIVELQRTIIIYSVKILQKVFEL